MSNTVYYEDLDAQLNKDGRKVFLLNYFFFNMLKCMSFCSNVTEMIDHSIKCDEYIDKKKQFLHDTMSSNDVFNMDEIIVPDLSNPLLDTREKVIKQTLSLMPFQIHKIGKQDSALVYQQTYILLHAYFEYHVKDLLNFLYKNRPEILTSSKKTMTHETILKAGNYESLISQMIQDEIDAFDRDNYTKKRKYFTDLIGDVKEWDHKDHGFFIKEINEMRNGLLHDVKGCLLNYSILMEVHDYLLKLGIHLWLGIKDKFRLEGFKQPSVSKYA